MAKRDYEKGMLQFPFVPIPKAVINSSAWIALPDKAQRLAIDLAIQYTGNNNGRLCPSFEVLQPERGWRSKTTLAIAKRALLKTNFTIETRKGHPPLTAAWIGFTWWKLNWEETMDIGPKGWPYLNFMTIEDSSIDPNVDRRRTVKTISVVQNLDRLSQKRAVHSPEYGPMNL